MAVTTPNTAATQKLVKINKSMRRHWKRNLAALILLILFVQHGLILWQLIQLRHSNPTSTSFIRRLSDEELAKGITPHPQMVWVPYQRISPVLVRAVITSEDRNFWTHRGFDLDAIWEAMQTDLKAKAFARGASTIDQQLARNLFLSPAKTPVRKLSEILIAVEMEHILGKQRILELYLNVIEWGPDTYGIEAASRKYFNTSAASLDTEQALFLASMIFNPRVPYEIARYSDPVQRRMNYLRSEILREPPGK